MVVFDGGVKKSISGEPGPVWTQNLLVMRIPPRQDCRGFYEFFVLSIAIITLSLVGYLRSEGQYPRICIVFAIVGVCGLIMAEGLSRPPHNGAHEFVRDEARWGKRDDDAQVLVCLGDSLTHAACSANWVDTISHQLEGQKQTKLRKLLVVNAGQSSICTHTILNERLDHVMDCRPDFVFVMIGTNDVMAIYRQDWVKDKMRLWNLPDMPSEEIIISIRNLTDIVKRLYQPPMGEDINCAANQLVQRINRCMHNIKEDLHTEDRFSVLDINDSLWEEINHL
jgi:lysophospholipase L1-like esterase